LADPIANKTILNQYRDAVVAEGSFSQNVSPEIKSKATVEEKEQICASANEVRYKPVSPLSISSFLVQIRG
jgi:hypothetical protein